MASRRRRRHPLHARRRPRQRRGGQGSPQLWVLRVAPRGVERERRVRRRHRRRHRRRARRGRRVVVSRRAPPLWGGRFARRRVDGCVEPAAEGGHRAGDAAAARPGCAGVRVASSVGDPRERVARRAAARGARGARGGGGRAPSLRNPRRRAARRRDADAAERQPELGRHGRRRALRHAAEECCRRRSGRARVDAQRLAARVLPRGAAARPPARDCRGRHRPRLVPPRRRALCGPRDWRCALRASAGARRHPRVPRAARRDGRGGDGRRRRPRRRDGGGGRRRLEHECAARARRDRRAAARARADAPTATGAVDGRWDAAGSRALPGRRLAVERLVRVGRPLHGGA